MRFSQVGVAVALCAIAQGFLLPPTITPADNELVGTGTGPLGAPATADEQLLYIECPGCPVDIVTLDGQVKTVTSPVESMFQFNFSISHGDKDLLLLNGVQIYPLDGAFSLEPLTADELVKTADGRWNYVASPKLGFSLITGHPLSSSSTPESIVLVTLDLRIVEIGQKPVLDFPIIGAKLLQTESGKLMKLMIGTIGTSTPQSISPTPDQECTSILCKWKAIAAEKISKLKGLKGCSGMKRPQPESVAEPKPVKPIHHGHPRPVHGLRPHRHHSHFRFTKFLRGLVFHVFVPIMIGVVVGILASVVGMVVGHIAIFIWRILFRRGQSARCHRVHEESISKNDEDAKSLLGDDKSPPDYEESPPYEDVDEKA